MEQYSEPLRIPDWLIVDAVRYATGRMSYQVGVTTAWIEETWQHIPESARRQIRQDLEREFERDDAARRDGREHKPLGMDTDRAAWERVRALWSANPASTVER